MKRLFGIALCLLLSTCNSRLSITQQDRMGDAENACLATSYEASKTSLYYDTGRTWAVGYADFNRDGLEDVLMGYVSRTGEATPIKMFLQQPGGELIEDSSLLPPVVPGTIHARKVAIGDFNKDGTPDAFIVDHGYDQPPFPGAKPVLLISKEGKFEERTISRVPGGFQHAASAADLTGDGSIDIFVTDTDNGAFLLVNDGTGNFTVTRRGVPRIKQGYYTVEVIDVDDDGYCDLLVGGHEHEWAATRIYWGNASYKYTIWRSTAVPRDVNYPIVLDVDAEDLNGDGVREIVTTRTKSSPFYEGYYFQVVEQRNRKLQDVSDRIAPNKVEWEGASSPWVPWIVLRDFNEDGYRDIVVPNKGTSLVYLNDGQGVFTKAR
ncbi:MAG: FG-GAP repeat domain-containing protein [Chloroflexota bacterium]